MGRKAFTIIGVIMAYQQMIAQILFGGGRHLGEQHISFRYNQAETWKVRDRYERRMAYLGRSRYEPNS